MRVLDLFSGIGGFSIGLEAAGFETVAFCEVSPVCRHLLAHHWPKVPCYDDIRTLTAKRLAADGITVDAICGGFPCQDLSYAGKGAGLAGERSGLWRDYARLIRELRPAFVIVENVAALLGRGLGDVLGDLAALGYDAWWDCIPASAVGAPHRRDRLWVVAYARGQQHEGYSLALRRAVAEELSRAALADASRELRNGCRIGAEQDGRDEPSDGGQDVADAISLERPGSRQPRDAGHSTPSGGRQTVDAVDGGLGRERFAQSRVGRMVDGLPAQLDRTHAGWAKEPETPRVASGVPARASRLHGLGNAVVPQIPGIIGRAIMRTAA